MLLRNLIAIYSKEKIWSKVAKRICRGLLLGIYRVRLLSDKWEDNFKNWYSEFIYVEKYHIGSPMLYPTGESTYDFMSRLTTKLYFKNYINSEEKNKLLEAFKEKAPFIKPESEYAQALLLKTFFEMSRFGPFREGNFLALPYDLRTIDELINVPLEIPLPREEGEFKSDITIIKQLYQSKLEWVNPDVVEFHLIKSFNSGDIEYPEAIEEVALKYPNLAIAHEQLNSKDEKTPSETIFVEKYHKYRERVEKSLRIYTKID